MVGVRMLPKKYLSDAEKGKKKKAWYSIEKDTLDNIDIDVILNDFESSNDRESSFLSTNHITYGVGFLFDVTIEAGILIYFLNLLIFPS